MRGLDRAQSGPTKDGDFNRSDIGPWEGIGGQGDEEEPRNPEAWQMQSTV